MSVPICEHCISGYLLPDTPSGSMETTPSGISYYLVRPNIEKVITSKIFYHFVYTKAEKR